MDLKKKKLCIVPICRKERFDLVHKFPMRQDRADLWLEALDKCGVKLNPKDMDHIRKSMFVCSRHFPPSSYKTQDSRSLNWNAVPSINLLAFDDPNCLDTASSNETAPQVTMAPSMRTSKPEINVLSPKRDPEPVKLIRLVKKVASPAMTKSLPKSPVTKANPSVGRVQKKVAPQTILPQQSRPAAKRIILKTMSKIATEPVDCPTDPTVTDSDLNERGKCLAIFSIGRSPPLGVT